MITYRLEKGAALTHQEGDDNFRTLASTYTLASRDPIGSDDATTKITVGSKWENTSTGDVFRCASSSPGNAVWEQQAVVSLVEKAKIQTNTEDIQALAFVNGTYRSAATANQTVINAGFNIFPFTLLFLNGVIANKNSYTTSGTTITVNTPLALDTDIVVLNSNTILNL